MVAPRLNDPLTAKQLRAKLDYDLETGRFTWKWRPLATHGWNTRYAGTTAGALKPNGYIQILLQTRLHLAHRLAYLWMTGEWPDGEIDHRDGNRANNAWNNLRPASSSQQRMNATRRADNTSGFKGVCWEPRRGYWYFEIRAGGKRQIFPNYATAEEAHKARTEAARRLHGTFARIE
jgi:hypothetical protein